MLKSLVWLRRDLRLNDHTVLAQACEHSAKVFVAFVFDTQILSKISNINKKDRRVHFIFESVMELRKKLRLHGGDLIILYGDPQVEIPKLAAHLKVQTVFVGRDYESYAKKRDSQVAKSLKKSSVDFISLKDHVVFEGLEVKSATDTPYKVFTPYKKNWLKKVRRSDIEERKPDLKKLAAPIKGLSNVSKISDIGFELSDIMILTREVTSPGEDAAQRQLKQFAKVLGSYKDQRDIPALESTSKLSMHFRFGTISIRQAVRLCQETRNEGSRTWLSELIWRDFYHMVLDVFAHVENKSFKPEFDKIKWPGLKQHFQAWTQGQTGFPIIDAAMRHFAKTGWMHNRLRMVVASFLVKDLLIDWRLGEKYFAENLLDFDLASNNGGWQWCASTGCDAQPYFRIFNPTSQSQRFDADGKFIRKHCPELSGFSNKNIHAPHLSTPMEQLEAGCIIGRDYPLPIVDHKTQREKILKLYKDAINRSKTFHILD